MGKRITLGLAGGLLGYLLGAFGGGFLVSVLSSNTHDRSIEAAMTGAFVLGPLAAIAGVVLGVRRARSAGSTPGAG